MSKSLTTQQIIDAVDGKLAVSDDWLDVFEYMNITGSDVDEPLFMKSAARFLESQRPGARWTTENFHQLVGEYSAGGIWDSAEELGRMRAEEDLEEGIITQAAYDKVAAENGWEAYAHHKPGQYIFPIEGKPGAVISIVGLEDFEVLQADPDED